MSRSIATYNVVLREVGGGTVGIVNVVGAVEVDGGGLVLDCFGEVFGC
jgi:hypothetical protein